MVQIGFHASHELFSPSELLRCVQLAEQLGFAAASCSDHFHPWSERDGQSGFAWSWLGAAMQSTSVSFGTVTAPGQRYHPAIVAQAAATLAEMYPGRLWLALGSGEALNEAITGQSWPPKPKRNERLRESAEILRALWRGETVTHRGLVQVQEARLYTRPAVPPLLLGAAITAETAEWHGSWADGLITVAKEPQELRQVVEAFRRGGGQGKPLFLQSAVSFADNDDEALDAAYHRWRHAGLDLPMLADLPTPRHFDTATADVPRDKINESLRVSSDIARHIEWIQNDLSLGFDRIYLNPIGRDPERFLRVFGQQVLPAIERASRPSAAI